MILRVSVGVQPLLTSAVGRRFVMPVVKFSGFHKVTLYYHGIPEMRFHCSQRSILVFLCDQRVRRLLHVRVRGCPTKDRRSRGLGNSCDISSTRYCIQSDSRNWQQDCVQATVHGEPSVPTSPLDRSIITQHSPRSIISSILDIHQCVSGFIARHVRDKISRDS